MSSLQAFSNKEFGNVRMVEVNGEPYAVGVDIARVLEYRKPSQAVIDHCKGIRKLGIPSEGGVQQTNIIPEGDIYRLIIKAADQSRNPEIKAKAEKFERWIFDEVIPSIGRHGAYMTPETIEKALLNPDTIIQLATQLKEEQSKRVMAEAEIEKQKPKVLFADSVQASDSSILVRELAIILRQNGIDIGQNRLFEWLRNNGYLVKRKGTDYNTPTQRAMDLGLFEVKQTAITHSDGSISVSKTSKVTGKGQIYFINKLLREEKAI